MRMMLIALVLSLSSCSTNPPPSLSPAGSAAFQATRVVKALDILRDFAIAANAEVPPIISTDNTRTIVNFHKAAVTTIGAVPEGWKATVTEGLKQLEHDVLPEAWARLLPYVSLVRSLIEVAL